MKFTFKQNIINEDKGKQKFKTYTNGNDEIKIPSGETPPNGYVLKKRVPWNKGLKADTDPRVRANVEKAHNTRKTNGSYVAWNKGLTQETDERVAKNIDNMKSTIKSKYGVDNISQYMSKQPGYEPWNKGLTKDTDERMKKASNNHKGSTAWNKGLTSETDDRVKSIPRTEETKEKIRQAHLKPDVQYKRFKTMESNGTLGINQDTVAEINFLNELLKTHSEDDIKHPYIDKERYPFKCDFYIVSEDKFIEVHGNWTHGGHPFDPNNEEDIKKLEIWKEKSKISDYYKNAIYTWTDLDVRKLKVAEENGLNFECVYYKY